MGFEKICRSYVTPNNGGVCILVFGGGGWTVTSLKTLNTSRRVLEYSLRYSPSTRVANYSDSTALVSVCREWNEPLNYFRRIPTYTVSQKNCANLFFLSELCQISTDCKNFWRTDSREQAFLRFTHFPPHLIYVNVLPCEMQMFKIVT